VFYPHSIIFPCGSVISQLNDCTPAFGFSDISEIATSDVGPTFTGTAQSTPDLNFSSTAIKTLLDLCTSFNICGDFSGGNVDVEYRAAANLGTREADASLAHLRVRFEANAYGSWGSLRAEAGGNAEIRGRIVPVYDGVNDPLVPTAGVALSATAAVTQLYTLGPVVINGTPLDLVSGFEWNNNLQYDEHLGNAGFFTWSSVRSMSPMVTVRSRKSSYLASFGTRGTALSSAKVYLRRRLKAGMNYAENQSQHILLSPLAGVIKARSLGNSGEVELSIHMEKSGAAFFNVSTATTIT
jgi:hypothetical protein